MLDNLGKLMKMACKGNKKTITIIIISALIISVIPAISIDVMQKIINDMQIGNKPFKIVFIGVMIYISINLIEIIFSYLQEYYLSKWKIELHLFFDSVILKKASKLSLKQYEGSDIYDIINRADGMVQDRIVSIFSTLLNMATTAVTTIFFMIKLFEFNVWITIVIMILPIMKFIQINLLNKKQYNIMKERTNESRKAWYYHHMMTNGDFFKEIKLNNLFKVFVKKYTDLFRDFNKQDINLLREQSVKLMILDIIGFIIDSVIFVNIVYEGYIRKILIGDAITYTRIISSLKTNVKSVLTSIANIKKDKLYIDFFFEFINLEEESNITNDENKIKINDEIQEIELRNVSFKYKTSDRYVLKNINLTLKKGTVFGIVGENGSGKTTLTKLIMGFYDNYEGNFFINGREFRTIDVDSYREKIGALLQDYIKFEATIRENLSYHNLKNFNNDKRLMELMKKFDVESIWDNEEKNLDTQLGYWFDSGRQISIGQWSKLALARSFNKNADIYILDEPNASLDPISEYKLSKLYMRVLENKLGIVVTHRLINMVEDFDQIIILDKGSVVEQGTHRELMRKSKKYRDMYLATERGEDIE